MGLSARVPAGADTAGFVPEIWASKLIDAMKNDLVCMDAVDFQGWQSGLKKGDTVNIGITNHVTATEVVVGTKAASLDIATGSKLQLVVNQWYEAPVDVDDMTMRQSQINWGAQARDEAKYAIDKKIDSTVAALFPTLNSSAVSGTDGGSLTDDLLLELVLALDEADVPKDNKRSLILDPSGLVDMLKIDKFVQANYVNKGAITNGNIGQSPIYGCMVKVTNNLTAATTGAYGAMLHEAAIAGAIQIEAPWMEVYKDLHLTRFQHEALWGVKEVRDTFGISFYTRHA